MKEFEGVGRRTPRDLVAKLAISLGHPQKMRCPHHRLGPRDRSWGGLKTGQHKPTRRFLPALPPPKVAISFGHPRRNEMLSTSLLLTIAYSFGTPPRAWDAVDVVLVSLLPKIAISLGTSLNMTCFRHRLGISFGRPQDDPTEANNTDQYGPKMDKAGLKPVSKWARYGPRWLPKWRFRHEHLQNAETFSISLWRCSWKA